MTEAPSRDAWGTARSALLVALAVATAAATYRSGERLGMSTTLSTRHAYYSLPYAVSQRYFGTRGYVILRDVAEVFIRAHPKITNETLAEAARLHPTPDRRMFFPADDKGDADFAIAAFALFGWRIESLYDGWFALYLAGIVAFCFTYWRHEARLAALCVATSAIYVTFFALPLTAELFSIHNPRAFGIVGLVPIMHLGFAIVDRQRLTAGRLLAAAVQAAIVAFAVHVRSTEWWQVLAVLMVFALSLYRPHLRSVAWPVIVLVCALAGLESFQWLSLDREYERTQLRHRIFWHNVGIGFAVNPELARKYELDVDDMPMIKLVRRRLVETNRADELSLVFMPAGKEEYQFNGIARDYVRYEREARGVVLSILWDNKWAAVKTFLVHKPRLLAKQLAWAIGYRGYSIDDLYLNGQAKTIATERDRADRMIYLNFFRPWALALLVVAAWLGGAAGSRRPFLELWGLSLLICAVSLLPTMAAYPIISNLGPPLATVSFFVLAGFTWLFARAIAPVTQWTMAAAARRAQPDDGASVAS